MQSDVFYQLVMLLHTGTGVKKPSLSSLINNIFTYLSHWENWSAFVLTLPLHVIGYSLSPSEHAQYLSEIRDLENYREAFFAIVFLRVGHICRDLSYIRMKYNKLLPLYAECRHKWGTSRQYSQYTPSCVIDNWLFLSKSRVSCSPPTNPPVPAPSTALSSSRITACDSNRQSPLPAWRGSRSEWIADMFPLTS